MDLLNEVNQQLADDGERDEDQVDYPLTSSPGQPTEPHVKFSTPSPSKSVTSPSKRSVVCHGAGVSACCLQSVTVPDCCFLLQFSPKTPPHWAEDHKSLLQMLCQQVESLKVRHIHHLQQNQSLCLLVLMFYLWFCHGSLLILSKSLEHLRAVERFAHIACAIRFSWRRAQENIL